MGPMTVKTQRWKLFLSLFFLNAVWSGADAFAQTFSRTSLPQVELSELVNAPVPASMESLPPAPAPASAMNAVIIAKKPVPHKQHSFFDRKNNLLMATSAVTLALDGLSTQRFLAYPNCRELNPIARPFVGTRAGTAGYFGLSFVGELALMRLAHKRNHHLLERIIPMFVIGSESSMVYNNYSLSTR